VDLLNPLIGFAFGSSISDLARLRRIFAPRARMGADL
jgi:hypothetical protein